MSYIGFQITQQPYYIYIEYLKYNVVPGIITLNFDSAPSSNYQDYLMIATQGNLPAQIQFGFSSINQTFSITGNNVALTVPVTMEFNCYMQFYYQNVALPFQIRADKDPTNVLPAIFVSLNP